MSFPRTETRTGLLLVLLAALAWGTIPLVVRSIDAIPVDVPGLGQPLNAAPVVIVFWRVAFSALALLPYMLAAGRLKSLVTLGSRTLLGLALNGILLAVHWVLFFFALVLTDVAVAELLTYTGPIYVAALTPLVLGEGFDRRVLLPIGLALAGIVIILAPGLRAPESTMEIVGAALAIVAAIGYALLMLNTKRLLSGVATSTIIFVESVVASIVLLPAALMLPAPSSTSDWAAMLVLGVVYSVLVVFVFMGGLRRVRADHAAVLMYAEPVTAVIVAALFLGEGLTIATLLGGVAVVTAGAIVARLAPTPGLEGPPTDLERPYEPGLTDLDG